MDLVKTRPVADSQNEMEFDYVHPINKKRVRRKIKITPSNAEMLCKLLNDIIENNLTIEELQRSLIDDPIYKGLADEFVNNCKILYFDYNQENEYFDYETEVSNRLNEKFKDSPEINICFLGKAGVGKSSIIRKMSVFSDNEINFPFVDTSRTSTYSAEYCFSSGKQYYQFAVAFMSEDVITSRFEECIERGVYKAISLSLKENDTPEKSEDEVMAAFYSDPAQLFDIRLIFGKHIKKTSKNYSLEKNQGIVNRWNEISQYCKKIALSTINQNLLSDKDVSFYQEKFTELLKSQESNEVKNLYGKLLSYVKEQIEQAKANILTQLEHNSCIRDIDYDSEVFSCKISGFDTGDFKSFISIFTSKNIECFGNSLLPFILKMRIELPYNARLSENVKAKGIRCFDTVGVAHTTESKGGFEKSTQLTLENIDAIIIADDSRLNMSNDTGIIIKHISARVDYRKIYFALTFFDEFTKAQFDPDEDINEQKIEYLISIQKEKINEYLEESDYSQALVKRVVKNAIFYLSGLKYSNPDSSENGYYGLNLMLETIRKDIEISKSKYKVCPENPSKPIVAYDYKKLSLLYLKSHGNFISSQQEIYFSSPPHFKTTEALTRRLKYKETYFHGARLLKPVDDFYNSLITQLNEFIMNPQAKNLVGENPDDVDQCIGELKSFITDKISLLVKQRFFTKEMLKEWNRLYFDHGSGVDYRRRKGIINAENIIAPNIESYLKPNCSNHLVSELEKLFNDCIEEFEKKILPKI